jgi:sugar diacid utilization regulator
VAATKVDTRTAALAHLVASLRARQGELVAEGVQRICAVPAYAQVADAAFVADLTRAVEVQHTQLLESVAALRPPEPEELTFVRTNATRRVGHIPLAAYMHAYRIYHEVFWEALLASASDDAAREVALETASVVTRYFNTASALAAEAYVEAEQLLETRGERVRRDLLEDLLAGRPVEHGPKHMAATEAELHATAPCVVVVAAPVTPLDDEHAQRSLAHTLARAVGTPAKPLSVIRHDQLVLIARVEGDVAQLLERFRRAQQRLTAQGQPLRLGVSSVHVGIERVPAAYDEAHAALEQVDAGGGIIALPELTVFECLRRFGRAAASARIPDATRRFLDDDRAHGGTLAATLLEYVASDFNAHAAARRLHIHPNTARYRLARIQERTNADLRRVTDVIDLVIAIHDAG